MSKPVSLTPPLPYPSFGRDLQELSTFDRDLVKSLVAYLSEVGLRLNGSLPKNGTEAMEGDLNMNGFDIVDVGNFVIDGPAGTSRIITFTTGDSTRWVIAVDNTPETGSNAGSDFAIYRYSDTGVFLGQAFYIQRSTGDIFTERHINVAGDANVTGDVGGATATITGNATVGGDLAVTDDITADQLRLTNTGDVTLASTAHAFQIGPDNGSNLAVDQNEIQARNNGAASFLSINDNGGDVIIGGADTSLLLDLRGGKIKFPATQVASGDAHVLDDYEEGTWTPTLRFGGATTGITYSSQSGTYIKIGRFVIADFVIVLTSKGTAVGNADVATLPFAPSVQAYGSTGSYSGFTGLSGNLTFAAFPAGTINVRNGLATGVGSLANTAFNNNTAFNGTLVYIADG